MKKMKVLFVCMANLQRSPTGEDIANAEAEFKERIEAKSAGVYATRENGGQQLDQSLIDWADEIVVMEPWMKTEILQKFNTHDKLIAVLEIPDHFERGDNRLMSLIRTSLQCRLAKGVYFSHGLTVSWGPYSYGVMQGPN